MTGNEFEYVGKARQCGVFVLPVESALKGVKERGAAPARLLPRVVGNPGPLITGPASHFARVRVIRVRSTTLPGASVNGINDVV